MESTVLPTPVSSLSVGSITVIFVLDRSYRKRYKKIGLKGFIKIIKIKKRG